LIQEWGENLALDDHNQREVQGRRKDGDIIDLQVGIAQISIGTMAIMINDVTRKKESERRQSSITSPDLDDGFPETTPTHQEVHDEKLFAESTDQKTITRGILDASFDAAFVINNQGIIQEVNETSIRVFGWSEDEFLGSNISIIMTSDVAAEHNQYLENYLKSGIKKMIGTQREVTAQRKDKSTFTCVSFAI